MLNLLMLLVGAGTPSASTPIESTTITAIAHLSPALTMASLTPSVGVADLTPSVTFENLSPAPSLSVP
jgi:hypothetical protein